MRFVSAVLSAALLSSTASAAKRYLSPGPLAIAYPSDGGCDDKVVTAVQAGLNVVIWSFINLGASSSGEPIILVDQLPDLDCVASTVKQLQGLGLNTTHMISIGGWGSPHPAVTNDPSSVYQSFKTWNEKTVARNGWPGFDGIDWDLEGVNDLSSPDNYFTVGCLDLVGKMSQMAKADGYLVSLVPPQSYLDVTTSAFDQNLTHAYPYYMPDFHYHSHNSYAYIISRYNGAGPDYLFDFISIQLYESYAPANYNVSVMGQSPSDYLVNYMPRVYNGWRVDFSSDPAVNWPTQQVAVPKELLVIGLANGWADPSRCLLLFPEDAGVAYNTLKSQGLEPRGFMFWDIDSEGLVPPGFSQPLYMAPGLNKFLHIR